MKEAFALDYFNNNQVHYWHNPKVEPTAHSRIILPNRIANRVGESKRMDVQVDQNESVQMMVIENKRIARLAKQGSHDIFDTNILILGGDAISKLDQIEHIAFDYLIIDGTNSWKTCSQLTREANLQNIMYSNLKQGDALQFSISKNNEWEML